MDNRHNKQKNKGKQPITQQQTPIPYILRKNPAGIKPWKRNNMGTVSSTPVVQPTLVPASAMAVKEEVVEIKVEEPEDRPPQPQNQNQNQLIARPRRKRQRVEPIVVVPPRPTHVAAPPAPVEEPPHPPTCASCTTLETMVADHAAVIGAKDAELNRWKDKHENQARLHQLQIADMDAMLARQMQKLEGAESLVVKFQNSLTCSICLDTLSHPRTLSCGHSFCQTCLRAWVLTHPECPHCRTKLTSVPHRSLLLREQIAFVLSHGDQAERTRMEERSDREADQFLTEVREGERWKVWKGGRVVWVDGAGRDFGGEGSASDVSSLDDDDDEGGTVGSRSGSEDGSDWDSDGLELDDDDIQGFVQNMRWEPDNYADDDEVMDGGWTDEEEDGYAYGDEAVGGDWDEDEEDEGDDAGDGWNGLHGLPAAYRVRNAWQAARGYAYPGEVIDDVDQTILSHPDDRDLARRRWTADSESQHSIDEVSSRSQDDSENSESDEEEDDYDSDAPDEMPIERSPFRDLVGGRKRRWEEVESEEDEDDDGVEVFGSGGEEGSSEEEEEEEVPLVTNRRLVSVQEEQEEYSDEEEDDEESTGSDDGVSDSGGDSESDGSIEDAFPLAPMGLRSRAAHQQHLAHLAANLRRAGMRRAAARQAYY